MKIKVSEAVGPVLDWMVAKASGASDDTLESYVDGLREAGDGDYSTDWSQGGPIIERECIATTPCDAASSAPRNPEYWEAVMFECDAYVIHYGPTPLIAAMRCFVASKLGDIVKVPKEMNHGA